MSAHRVTHAAGSGETTFTAEHERQLEREGFVVLPNILSEDDCDLLSATFDRAWEQSDKVTLENGSHFVGNVLYHSPLFQKCVVEPTILAAVRSVIGRDVVLNHINGRRPDPGSGLQPLHHFSRRCGPPFDKCATIYCLDEFTERNGCPRVLPGSHVRHEPFQSRCVDPLLPHPDEVYVVAPRGAVVVHNSHLIHGGTLNRSQQPRRSVLCGFTSVGSAADYKPKYPMDALPPSTLRQLSSECIALLGLP